jgi:cardiolipin synthase
MTCTILTLEFWIRRVLTLRYKSKGLWLQMFTEPWFFFGSGRIRFGELGGVNCMPPSPNGTAASEREAQLVLRDNLLNRNRIERAYLKAIGDARQEVLIANAYFLPGGKLRRALVHAAHRGVRVRLLLQGRYENFMQFHASRPILGVLLAAGVEIHEYSGGFLHAKVAVIDGVWSTVGSSNLDPLSLLLAREANVVVQNPAFAEELRTCLTNAMQTHSVKLDSLRYSSRRWRWVVLDWFAYGVMRLLLFASRKRY